jgi:hypothetical protein
LIVTNREQIGGSSPILGPKAKKCRLRKPASQAKRTGFSPFNERNAGLLRKLVEELHDRADIDGGEML